MVSKKLNDTKCLTRRALITKQSTDSSPTNQKEDFENKVELSVGSLRTGRYALGTFTTLSVPSLNYNAEMKLFDEHQLK